MLKKLFITMLGLCSISNNFSQTNAINYPIYAGKDLGCFYKPTKTTIKVYAPTASELKLNLYNKGTAAKKNQETSLQKSNDGVWQKELLGNMEGFYYTLQAKVNNIWSEEVTDPYAKAVSVNGNRVAIIDFEKTNPTDWSKDVSPTFTNTNNLQDAVIYELHLRDISMHPTANIDKKGKYLGLTELNTVNSFAQSTGLQHIKNLGVTHVHILPAFDFNSIDENTPNSAAYNWGYDPKNYNVPEGSYSTNATEPSVRIKEFKQMVAALHQSGLNVVMDVVYNHTAVNKESNFHQLVPGYYHRMKSENEFADASGCSNETASEQPMMRKFMIESLEHWVKEYHIDGFRFDLMAIHDVQTMNEIAISLQKIKPNILLYGEGWAAGTPQYDINKLATKTNVSQLNHIAVFSDDIRDAIKGYVFDKNAKGFVNGNPTMQETIKFGIVGCTQHPQVNMEKCFYEKKPYATKPQQVISYVDCHDNLTLFDKLAESAAESTPAQRVKMQQLALGLVLTSQGIPFLHAGSEFLRSKKGVENSYNKSDEINAINWDDKNTHLSTYNFVKDIIAIRKKHTHFKLHTEAAIQQNLNFLDTKEGVVAFTITSKNDEWKKIMVVCNTLNNKEKISIAQKWKTAIKNDEVHMEKESITVEPLSFSILYQE
jgi:pullulanase